MTVGKLEELLAGQDKKAHVIVATDKGRGCIISALEVCGEGEHTGSIMLIAVEQSDLQSLMDVGKGIIIIVAGT